MRPCAVQPCTQLKLHDGKVVPAVLMQDGTQARVEAGAVGAKIQRWDMQCARIVQQCADERRANALPRKSAQTTMAASHGRR